MIIDTDMHSHVSRSSAWQMVLAAQQKGLRVLGLSEHVFQMQETRLALQHLEPEGPLLTFNSYIEDVRTVASQSNVDTRLGLEVDFIPGKNELIHSLIQEYNWDFLIGSVHEINGIQFEANHKWSREEGEALWLQYFALLRRVVTSGHFSVVSHPVRMRVKNPHLPPTFDEELEQLAAEATRNNAALEINGYDVLHYHSLVRRLAKACVLHSTPISVGSDAHSPKAIAQAHQQTEDILREVGISKIRLWKQMKAVEYFI
ncbi:MAG TPA: PHP domain-containing protein [Ktedonobacteraceae bacterium]